MYRNYGLDLARILAAYMVMAGHLIFGGSVSTGKPYSDWAGNSESLPLLSENSLWKLDSYLLQFHGTALAIIGVSLFFIISGWLMPPMLKKYTRATFLLNRALRIFPMLFVAVLISAAIQYCWGDSSGLKISDIFATATLVNTITGNHLTLGVVWTLIIEFEFYLLLAALGQLSHGKILATCAILLAITAFYSITKIQPPSLVTDFYYIIFMLVGSGARIAYDRYKTTGISLHLFLPLAVLVFFEANRYLFTKVIKAAPPQDINIASIAITAAMFLFFAIAGNKISKNRYSRWIIEKSSDLTYSIYLIHLPVGVFLISRIRHHLDSDYAVIAGTFLAATLLSALTYRTIELPGITIFKKINSYMSLVRFGSAMEKNRQV